MKGSPTTGERNKGGNAKVRLARIVAKLKLKLDRPQILPVSPIGKPAPNYSKSITRVTPVNSEPSPELGNSGLRRMMVALAQYPHGKSATQVGVLAGISSKGGSFGVYLGKGRSSGWIEGGRDLLRITERGLAALGSYEPLPTGQELLRYWLNELGGSGAARILQVLADAYPESMSRESVGMASGISHVGGSFGVYLGKLRTLELISKRGELRASETLFE
jgi:hypothetical protein